MLSFSGNLSCGRKEEPDDGEGVAAGSVYPGLTGGLQVYKPTKPQRTRVTRLRSTMFQVHDYTPCGGDCSTNFTASGLDEEEEGLSSWAPGESERVWLHSLSVAGRSCGGCMRKAEFPSCRKVGASPSGAPPSEAGREMAGGGVQAMGTPVATVTTPAARPFS